MTVMNFQIKQPNNPNKTGLTMNEHTLTQLRSLRLDGMVRALEEQAVLIRLSPKRSVRPLRVVAGRDIRHHR